MKIVDAEHVFGGERIIFYFMAEDRIDFRDLVRQLAREFQTRIEMRQVGLVTRLGCWRILKLVVVSVAAKTSSRCSSRSECRWLSYRRHA